MHCSIKQHSSHCIVTHCNALQHTAAHCSALQRTATHGNALHALQRTQMHSSLARALAPLRGLHINALQHTATDCNTLQHTTLALAFAPLQDSQCNTLLHTIAYCHTRMCIVADCNTLQQLTTCNSTLHVSHCNTLHHPFFAYLRKSKAFPAFLELIYTDMAYLMIAYAHKDCNALQFNCNTLYKHSIFDGCPHAQRLQHTATHCNALLQHTGKHFTIIACTR